MEIQSILIFAIVGAILMMVIVGGASAMMTEGDESPTSGTLAGGALIGSLLGAAVPHLSKVEASSILEQIGGGNAPDMQVGLPTF